MKRDARDILFCVMNLTVRAGNGKNIYHTYIRLGQLSDSPFKFGGVESLVKHGRLH